MPPLGEALHVLLNQPLDYLHPARGAVALRLQGPASRQLLNRLVLRELGLSCPAPEALALGACGQMWLRHWQQLPRIAWLMGGQLMWPQLALGARMGQLDAPSRAFARMDLGVRRACGQAPPANLDCLLRASGLNALMAWRDIVPWALVERLPLLFSPQEVQMQRAMPAQPVNSLLFFLAVQHAQFNQGTR